MKLASFADLSVGSSPRMSHGFCVATPVGHFPVWQTLRLNAANREHGFSGNVNHIASHRHCGEGLMRES